MNQTTTKTRRDRSHEPETHRRRILLRLSMVHPVLESVIRYEEGIYDLVEGGPGTSETLSPRGRDFIDEILPGIVRAHAAAAEAEGNLISGSVQEAAGNARCFLACAVYVARGLLLPGGVEGVDRQSGLLELMRAVQSAQDAMDACCGEEVSSA